MLSTRRVLLVAVALALLAVLQPAAWALKQLARPVILPAQPVPNPALNAGKPGVFTDGITYDTRPEFKRYINAAQDCIRDKDWDKAAKALQEILDNKKDFSVEVTHLDPKTKQESTRRVSVRFEANRLIGEMPADGLDTYQRLYGGQARERLDEAKRLSDPAILAEVAQRYMHTAAGAEANDLLATYRLDRGDFFGAAESFKRLLEMARKREKPVEVSPLTLFKAALAFRRAGDEKAADKTWQLLADKIRKTGLKVGDDTVSLTKLEDMYKAVDVRLIVNLKDWPMVGGSLLRSAQADGSAPLLEPKWKHSIIRDAEENNDHNETRDWVNAAVQAQEKFNVPVVPGFHAVAASGKLVYRTYHGVAAVYIRDGESGGEKHLAGEVAWKSSLLKGGLSTLLGETNFRQVLNDWQAKYRQSFQNLIIENTLVGTLATDRGKVYLVDDLAVPPHPLWLQQFAWNGGQANYPAEMKQLVEQNSLQAYDLESGKLLWDLPNPANPGDLAESHFLGAPVSVGGKLYVLNEKKSELRLLCLEPREVDPAAHRWEVKVVRAQVLCGVKEPLTRDIVRRSHAVMMAYGEGILVVPTNAGAVLGVDLLTQSLIWSYPYREGVQPQMPAVNQFGRPWGGARMTLSNPSSGFKLTPPVIQNGKVVFAAPDGDSIHCVDLREGTRLWHVKRGDDVYLGGVYDGKVLLVGKGGCRALNLETGKQLWAMETGTPTGLGVASRDIYYLPVKNKDKQGEICTIDLKRGVVKAHNTPRYSKSDAKPPLPGNLLFHEGSMLSESVDLVAAYPQLDVKIREINVALAKTPNDPYWLAERGEYRLADGKVKEAVADLRQALANKPGKEILERTRGKLYEAFTELFQNDFNFAVDQYLDEYKEMCKADDATETGRRQARFLYLIGRGRENQGKLVEAYQAYAEFAALPLNKGKVNDIDDPYLKASPEVWVRGRIAAMIKNADPARRKPLEDKIAQEWQAIQSKNDLDALRNFVQRFDVAFKVGREARLHLAESLMERNDRALFAEAEMVLKQLQVAGLRDDPTTLARAIDALARLEIRKGTTESMKDAARYYRTLGTDFATVVVRDGQTGADLFSELATDKRFLPYLDVKDLLRITGKMNARKVDPNTLRRDNSWFQLQNAFTFEPEGDVLPFVRRHRLMFSLNSRQLMWVDAVTNNMVKWPENGSLPELTNNQYFQYLFSYNQTNNLPNGRFRFYQVRGHVAAVQIGPLVYGLDLAGHKVLWHRNLLENAPVNVNFNIQADPRDGTLQMVTYDPFTSQPYTRKIGQLGNLEGSYVCIQTQKGLVALDPLKGTELWTKTDVPARTQIFGDDQYIYLVEVRDGTVVGNARCLRASDGVKVEVPDFATAYQGRLRILGRNLLVSETVKGEMVLRLYDVRAGKDLWKKTFDAKAIPLHSLDRDLTGAVASDGTITVVDLRTGKETLRAKVDPADLKDVKEVLLLDDGTQFYVALNKPVDAATISGGVLYSNFANGTRGAQVNGMFYAFDRAGQLRWNYDVPNQMVVLDQFANMPMVLFTVRYNVMNRGGGFQRWQAATRSIDKRTGKLLYDPGPEDNAQGYQYYALNLNVKTGTIDLVGSQTAVQHYVDDNRRPRDKGNLNQPRPQPQRLQPQPLPRRQGAIRGGIRPLTK